MDYISRKEFANSIGLKDSTVRGWQERHWVRGTHYLVIGKTTLLVKKEVDEWLNSRRDSQSKGAELRSEPKLMENRIRKPSEGTVARVISPLR